MIRDRIRINEEVRTSGDHISLSSQASRYLIVGETDAALDYYKKAREEGDGFIAYVALEHLSFPELKTNPRYLALLKELDLPPPGDLKDIKYKPIP